MKDAIQNYFRGDFRCSSEYFLKASISFLVATTPFNEAISCSMPSLSIEMRAPANGSMTNHSDCSGCVARVSPGRTDPRANRSMIIRAVITRMVKSVSEKWLLQFFL